MQVSAMRLHISIPLIPRKLRGLYHRILFSQVVEIQTRHSIKDSMAKILRIKDVDQLSVDEVLDEAAGVLSSGGLIALPTDTIYGLAVSVHSKQGIERLYNIKGRNRSKPIAICVDELESVDRWAKRTVSLELLQDLLPGKVTTVFERRDSLPSCLNTGNPLVGVRIPDHKFIRQLVQKCGHPIALTSANISDTRSTLDVEEFTELWPQLDLVVDGGRIVDQEGPASRKGSTVVNLAQEGKFTIIRQGSSHDHVIEVLRAKHNLTETIT